MPQTSLIQAYKTSLQYTLPRRCMCFTIISLMWSYPTHPKAKLHAPSYCGKEPFLYT